MNKLIGMYYLLQMIIYEVFKEVISRILSIVMFPLAFLLRRKIRKHLYSIDEVMIKEVTFDGKGTNNTKEFYTKVNWFYFILWIFLDDSTARDSFHSDGTRMYDASDRDTYFPKWVLATKWFWLRAAWWSILRNNAVNFVTWNITGGWKEPLEVKEYLGAFNELTDKNDDNSYYVEGMYLVNALHKDGSWSPRFTYVGEVMGRKVGVWVGKSRWSGRFSFSLRG